MNSQGRRLDHWTISLDTIEALRQRIAQVEDFDDDAIARRLMASVAHAKSSGFMALVAGSGNVLDVNPAALISGGVGRAEVLGLPLWMTAWWSDVDDAAVQALERAVVAAGKGRHARFDVDVRMLGSGQPTGTLDLLLRPLRGRDGQVAFIVAEGRSITDRKLVEKRLAQQNAELSALTQRLARVHDYRERLLGELSHDLKAPLQIVITRTDQMLRTDPEPDFRAQLVSIRLAALSALEQISDMLEQVKADHGEARLTLVEADLAQAVRTVAEQFEPLAANREVALHIDAPTSVTARFDVERVSRVVSNLLANAIRHAPVGGRVSCSLATGDAAAILRVADSGAGVPVEQRARIFGRFQSGV